MKELTKYFIDLSKLSEEQRNEIEKVTGFSLTANDYPYLIWLNGRWDQGVKYHIKDRTELTYPEFIKLFEGGEGEKTDSIITDRAIDLVFQNTSFGENPNYRQILKDGIEKVKEGYANGRTVSLCLLELGLVEHSNEYSVTKIGEVFFAEPLNSNQ